MSTTIRGMTAATLPLDGTELIELDVGAGVAGRKVAASNFQRIAVKAASADYTVLDDDGYTSIMVTTGAADKTITLPTVAANTNRILKIIKADSGAGAVIIDGEGAETINANAAWNLISQYQFYEVISNGTTWDKTGGHIPLYHLQQQETSGTGGGSASAGTWVERGINTELVAGINGASLASDQVTLPPGRYSIEAVGVTYEVGWNAMRWYNETATAEVLRGIGLENNASAKAGTSILKGEFTITAASVFALDHYTAATKATIGFGSPGTQGTEIYGDIKIYKLA